jgi:hypothetical protein
MTTTSQADNGFQVETVTSYRDLRRGIGILGLALPLALIIGHRGLQQSISSFYYSDMRNWFVGSMWATGFFLIFYRYQRVDNILTSVAGVLAILVSMCPTTPGVLHPSSTSKIIGALHLTFAGSFLLVLAFICFFLFTRSSLPPGERGTLKGIRNGIYRGCGIAIAAAIVAAALFELVGSQAFRSSWNPVFWCESVAVAAFGAAWLIKGETLFQDPAPSGVPVLQVAG